jgi:hypothetical protein
MSHERREVRDHEMQDQFVKWLRRVTWFLAGFLGLLWLGYEDRGLASLIALSTLVAFGFALEVLFKWANKRPIKPMLWLLRGIIIGSFAGAIIGPIAIVLALMKISLHHHLTPDFELVDLKILVGQSLSWIAAGGLFGAAGGFLKLAQKR